ncbi:MAG: sialate O-acetylesterase, partial [Verrucomicrobiota bacterium]
AIAQNESHLPLLQHWDDLVKNYDPKTVNETFNKRLADWKEKRKAAEAAGKPIPRAPRRIRNPEGHHHRPANLYNGMIAPLIPFAMRGAIWYQGESNHGRAYQYRTLFPAMITNWRESWGQDDFPFYYVQIANFRARTSEPVESAWAEVRESQAMAMNKLKNVGQAVIIDIGMANDIHPKNKEDVGKRLARWALNRDYGMKEICPNGPLYQSMSVKGNKAVLDFELYGSALMAWDKQALKGFAIAGEDRKFVWANAKMTGKQQVEVWSDEVAQPAAVRYGWADNPEGNLYNRVGLPASPFRTDDWPGVTVDTHF